MKIVLMVAAGIAVGLTVVLAMLVQILTQLMPLLVVLVVVMLVLQLVRGRNRGQHRPADHVFAGPYPAAAPVYMPIAAPALREVDSAPLESYLRWGPPSQEELNAAPVLTPRAAGPQVRRTSAGNRPSRAVRGRRP